MRWLAVALLFLPVLTSPLTAEAQPAVARIGWLQTGSKATNGLYFQAFRQGLRELGYLEGQTVIFEERWADGRAESLPALAEELVRLKVDVIVTTGTPAAQAAKRATTIIPIVVAAAGDFVGVGLATTLARPGGNLTGTSDLTAELSGKRLELLQELTPGLAVVAVLWNAGNPGARRTWDETRAAGRTLGLQLHSVPVRGVDELDRAFDTVASLRADAVVVVQDPFTSIHRGRITQLAAKHRLPAMYGGRLYTESGGLISYGPNLLDLIRRSAGYVDRILKGAKPADLPIEQPTKFELVINLKTAKALGLTIPQSVLIRADEIIQ